MRIGRRGFVGGALLLFGSRAKAAPPDLGGLLARIARARETMRTLEGPFEQTRTIGLLATDVRSSGKLTLVRPDWLRWELAPPDEVTFWVGPEGLAFQSAHGHGSSRTASGGLGAALDDLRTLLGGDLMGLQTRWDLRVVKDDATGAELEAAPRANAAAPLRRIEFSLAPDLARPKRAVLIEGPRDRTLIEFGTLAINVPVDDARMRPPH